MSALRRCGPWIQREPGVFVCRKCGEVDIQPLPKRKAGA